jgi:hypothetical protein
MLFAIAGAVVYVKYRIDNSYLSNLRRKTLLRKLFQSTSFFTGMFTFITSTSFSPLRCYPQADGSFNLIPNPTQDCYGLEWKEHSWIVAFGILELIAIPSVLITILSRYKKNHCFILTRKSSFIGKLW